MPFKRIGSYCINPDNVNYVMDDRDETPSHLTVYFAGSPALTFTGKDADEVAETLGVPKKEGAASVVKPTSFATQPAPKQETIDQPPFQHAFENEGKTEDAPLASTV